MNSPVIAQNMVRGITTDLAKQLDFLFEKGAPDESQLLCEALFKRLSVKEGQIVEIELNPPFRLITGVPEGSQSFQFGSGGWIRTNDLRVVSPFWLT